jgi:hypothetical protein
VCRKPKVLLSFLLQNLENLEMAVLMVIMCIAILTFTMYAADLMHKMKDDIRMLKIRTGKTIHLLDAVLTASGGKAAELAGVFRERTREAEAKDQEDKEQQQKRGDGKAAPLSKKSTHDDGDGDGDGGGWSQSAESVIQAILAKVKL